MPTVFGGQVRTSTTWLDSPLPRNTTIELEWKVQDEHGRQVGQQSCTLDLGFGRVENVQLAPGDRTYTFHLSRGTQLDLPLTARLHIHLSEKLAVAGAAAVAAEDMDSDPIRIRFSSGAASECDAIKTVYSELSQELRRMRTLYETFLIVVTGGFATLVSKADSIAGSQPERVWMARGVIGLALIVVYLLWQVAPRYRRSSTWIKNLERALGLRAEGRPAVLMPEDPSLLPINKANLKTWWYSWWNKDAWLHTTWALLLTGYTLFAGFFSFRVIQKAPEHTAIQNPAAQTVQRIEQVFQVPAASPGKQETGKQKKH